MPILFDPRGHMQIRALLSDISEEKQLAHGDCMWLGEDGFSVGIEVKSIQNLLSSVAMVNQETGYSQLYTQLSNLVDFYDIPVLMVYGVYSNAKDGTLKIPGFKTKWRYLSVEGILMDAWTKGCYPLKLPSLSATALVIRSFYEKSMSRGKKLELRKAKLFSYTGKQDEGLRILASLPGINTVLGRRVYEHFKTVRQAITSASWRDVEGIGSKKDGLVQLVLDKPWGAGEEVRAAEETE